MKTTILDPADEKTASDGPGLSSGGARRRETSLDAYFSADVETDGPIPGPYSILSFALVFAGSFDGSKFKRPENYRTSFYKELRPISDEFQEEALRINGLDRARLSNYGAAPEVAMNEAFAWIKKTAGEGNPVLVAFPLSFDWTWLYWYFTRFSSKGSPFGHSQCFDIKTAVAIKAKMPISLAARSRLPDVLAPVHRNTHHALDDAIAQAEIFANVFEWKGL
jgi:DNA polymerase III epsilon subunit-like protein